MGYPSRSRLFLWRHARVEVQGVPDSGGEARPGVGQEPKSQGSAERDRGLGVAHTDAPPMPRPHIARGLLVGAVAGLAGAFVKSLVEPPLQTAAEAAFPPTAAQKNLPGADIQGHPERMPPATMAQRATDQTLSKEE